METIERIIFLQNDEADKALALYSDYGPAEAAIYLQGWHYPGEMETAQHLSHGTSDKVYFLGDGYVLTVNTDLNYIGMEYSEQFEES